MTDWDALAAEHAAAQGAGYKGGALLERFVIPPFSVLDARQGYWQDRKRMWLALGIQSELGRGDQMIYNRETVRAINFYETKRRLERELGRPVTTAELTADLRSGREELQQVTAAHGRGQGRAFNQDLGKRESWDEVRVKRGQEAQGPNATDEMIAARGKAPAAPPAESMGLVDAAVDTRRFVSDMRSNLNAAAELPDYADFGMANVAPGTSIFDPVLAEMHYRWFAPPGGAILDPFAGGSVRGIIAAVLGHAYTGVDLSGPQVDANRDQAATILSGGDIPVGARWVTDPDELTPVDQVGEIRVKRDDLFTFGGVRGGKVRTCLRLALGATAGLVTAGSRSSPQVNIVAHVGRSLGLPVRAHTPEGALSPEVLAAQGAGAEIVQHPAGYNNVIKARARDDAHLRDWTEIPFGMECAEAVAATASQVWNVPTDVARIVVPVGSGMTLAGILTGLDQEGRSTPVVGVVVGADPIPQLDRYAPANWRERVTLTPSGSDYHDPAPDPGWDGIVLDPHYEAKAVPFLQDGDLLWVVGVRQSAVPSRQGDGLGTKPIPRWIVGDSATLPTLIDERERFDYVFSCPPYFDLEVYSDDPRDLSAMTYEAFVEGYRAVIKAAVDRLRPGRFATFVVSEVRRRDDRGQYRGLVPDTIRAFEDAGAVFYNEAILLNAVGSLPMRVAKQFDATRKLGRMHQNVLTFLKGPIPRGWDERRDTAPDPQLALFAPEAAPAPIAAPEPVGALGPPDGAEGPVPPEDDPVIDAIPNVTPAPTDDWFGFDPVADAAGEPQDPTGLAYDSLGDGRWVDQADGTIYTEVKDGHLTTMVPWNPPAEPEPEPVRSVTEGLKPVAAAAPLVRVVDPGAPFDPTWDATDPDRGCYTCGRKPSAYYSDGSPKYDCIHVEPPGEPSALLGLGLDL